MHPDFDALSLIDQQISVAEEGRDVQTLAQHLAPAQAFDESPWNVVKREDYLRRMGSRGPAPMAIQSIVLLAPDEAVVSSVVTVNVNGKPTAFERARLFVRTEANEWKLAGPPGIRKVA